MRVATGEQVAGDRYGAEIVRAEARGLHRLYVVLTRAGFRLDILHAEPLPAVVQPFSGRVG